MGEVYKARDTRLNRLVAIKVSQERFSERFAREALAAAALSHPNICTLYDVGPDYLVMELLEGGSLASRLQKGPLPVGESLTPPMGNGLPTVPRKQALVRSLSGRLPGEEHQPGNGRSPTAEAASPAGVPMAGSCTTVPVRR
jgi:serine/threonine protein kinase